MARGVRGHGGVCRAAAGVGYLWFKETNTAPDATALRPARLLQSLRRIAAHPQSRFFLIVSAATQFGIVSFVANGPRFFKSAFGIEGLEFALLFAATGLGIILGQIANNRLIARLGVLATTRVAAFILAVVTSVMVALQVVDAMPGAVFAGLMFAFNTSFLVVIANSASLVIDPHREIAGFASSAYGFATQITASVLTILTAPLFAGALLPWSLTLLAVTVCVFALVMVYRPAPAAAHPAREGQRVTLRAEKMRESFRGLFGRHFREEMPAVDGLSLHLVGPLAPQRQRPAIVVIPVAESAAGGPQRQHRTGDAGAACGPPRLLAVDPRCGAILLADRMGVGGIAQRLDIGRADLGRKRVGGRAPLLSALSTMLGRRGEIVRAAARAAPAATRARTPAPACVGALPDGLVGRMSSTASRSTRSG